MAAKKKKKKIEGIVKLHIMAGAANPSPPIGPALSQHGVQIMDFCKQFNARTKALQADQMKIPTVITVYSDKSFDFITKEPPAAALIRKELGIAKGSGESKRKTVAKISQQQIRNVAEKKIKDMNCTSIDSAMKQITGTAVNMGIEILRT